MNENTLVSVHCYDGDSHQVKRLLPYYAHHTAPVVILSPTDGAVKSMSGHVCRIAGRRSYIGQVSLDRQIEHCRILLQHNFGYYLLNDSDSFCVSAEIDRRIYEKSDNTIWSNEVGDSRPHSSPYPKLAFQPPYFLNHSSLAKLVAIAPSIRAHPITPYIDWAMVAWSSEAGLQHRAFTELEHRTNAEAPFTGTDSWLQLEYRIKHFGTTMLHPIKTEQQVKLCVEAREFYEKNR